MAKKKKCAGLGKFLSLISVALGALAIGMIFADVVKTADVKSLVGTVKGVGVSGLKVVFGSSVEGVDVLAFSILAILPWAFVLVGAVLSAINVFAKKNSNAFDYIAIAAFFVAGVLYFLMPHLMTFADTAVGTINEALDWKLAIGSVIAAISSLVAGAIVIAKSVLKK